MNTIATVRSFALLLALVVGALTACGNETSTHQEDGSRARGPEPLTLVIETRVELPAERPRPGEATATGTVLSQSMLGDDPFCPGGTFSDRHGSPDIGLADRSFVCADGTLRVGFSPRAPEGRSQSGAWKIIDGTGVFLGLRGSGDMSVEYEDAALTQGQERFIGTVVPHDDTAS